MAAQPSEDKNTPTPVGPVRRSGGSSKKSFLDIVAQASGKSDASELATPTHWTKRGSRQSKFKNLIAKHKLHQLGASDRTTLQLGRIVDPTKEVIAPFKTMKEQGFFLRVFLELRRYFDGDEYAKRATRDWFSRWLDVHEILKEEHRQAVLSEGQRKAVKVFETSSPGKRSPEDLDAVCTWAAMTVAFAKVERESMEALAQRATVRHVPMGVPLFFQGSRGDAYWVIVTGELGLFAKSRAPGEPDPAAIYRAVDEQQLMETKELLETDVLGTNFASVGSGIGLGELSIINKGTKRACAAVASSQNCVAMRITPQLYNDHLRQGHKEAAEMGPKIEFVKSVSFFKNWTHEDVTRLVYTLKDESFIRGCTIAMPGDRMTRLQFIQRGSVHVTHPTGRVDVAALGPRDVIGMEALASRVGTSSTRSGKAAAPENRFKTLLVAQSDVTVLWVDIDEAFKFFSGQHGAKSLSDIRHLAQAQRARRAEHYRQMRKHQKRTAQQRKIVASPFHQALHNINTANHSKLASSNSSSSSSSNSMPTTTSITTTSGDAAYLRSFNPRPATQHQPLHPPPMQIQSLPSSPVHRCGASAPIPLSYEEPAMTRPAISRPTSARPATRMNHLATSPLPSSAHSSPSTRMHTPRRLKMGATDESNFAHDGLQWLPTLVPGLSSAVSSIMEIPSQCDAVTGHTPTPSSLAHQAGWSVSMHQSSLQSIHSMHSSRRQQAIPSASTPQPHQMPRGVRKLFSPEDEEQQMHELKEQIWSAESNMRITASLMNRQPRKRYQPKEKFLTRQQLIAQLQEDARSSEGGGAGTGAGSVSGMSKLSGMSPATANGRRHVVWQ